MCQGSMLKIFNDQGQIIFLLTFCQDSIYKRLKLIGYQPRVMVAFKYKQQSWRDLIYKYYKINRIWNQFNQGLWSEVIGR